MTNYNNTGEQKTPTQLAEQLKQNIPTQVKTLALQEHKKDESASNLLSAHKVLDLISIERIEATLADNIPLDYLCTALKITQGQFWSWVHSDDEKVRRIHKAQIVHLQAKRTQLLENILNTPFNMPLDKDEREMVKLQLKSVSIIDETLKRHDPKHDTNEGVKIMVDFGSLIK